MKSDRYVCEIMIGLCEARLIMDRNDRATKLRTIVFLAHPGLSVRALAAAFEPFDPTKGRLVCYCAHVAWAMRKGRIAWVKENVYSDVHPLANAQCTALLTVAHKQIEKRRDNRLRDAWNATANAKGFLVAGTKTGRIRSSAPNLPNLSDLRQLVVRGAQSPEDPTRFTWLSAYPNDSRNPA